MIIKPSNVQQGKPASLPYTPLRSTVMADVGYFQSSVPLLFDLWIDETAITTNEPDAYAEFETLGRLYHTVQTYSASGTYGATVLVEATLDGTGWFTLDTLTTATLKQYTGFYAAIRTSITAYTSGQICVVGGTMR